MMFDYVLRGSLQQSIDKSKDLVSRNKMGQYATPKSLASEICQYVGSISKWSYPIEVLEPALGLGIFIEVFKFETDLDINRYTGIELDEDFFNAAEKLWRGFNVDLVKSDFMLFNTNKKFQIIISNPPYVRHHHLSKDYKTKIQNLTSPAFGDKMSKLAGLYCFFMGKAHNFLAKDGISVWLIPSEFLDVNYGKVLKEYLLKKVELIHIHKYKKEDNLFENAIVSSCVVLFKQKQENSSIIRFSYGGRISNPTFNNSIDSKLIKSDSKWSNYFGNRQSKNIEIKTRIEDYFNVKRGLVTGNNKFFILGKKEIEHHGIGRTEIR